MKHRSPATGRPGLLAAPLVLAALAVALSACGNSALSGSAASNTTSPPANTSPAGNSAAPGNTSLGSSSAPSGSSGPSPNTAQFCWTWQETAPYFSKDFAVLGNDPNYDMSTPAVLFDIATVGISAGLRNASEWAPAAVSPDMKTVLNYWNASYADFRHEASINQNVTVAQVKAYIMRIRLPRPPKSGLPCKQCLAFWPRTAASISVPDPPARPIQASRGTPLARPLTCNARYTITGSGLYPETGESLC